MPRLNKVRIINFSYNNDKRVLIDETYDFLGKNSLVLLKNGGGKSVLTQLMLQPLVPMLAMSRKEENKVIERTFPKLFRKDNEPSYILLEWILDNKSKMICGIGVKRKTTVMTDETGGELEYYTFIIEYKGMPSIENVPLCEVKDNRFMVTRYEESKKVIENLKSKPYSQTYAMKSKPYLDRLLTYKINPHEWKNIVARINAKEGGLIEVFNDSPNSAELMKNWILKNIQTNLSETTGIDDLYKRTTMYIEKAREKLYERETRKLLNNYKYKVGEISVKTEELKGINDEAVAAQIELANLKYSLNENIGVKKEESINLNQEIENANNRLAEIDIEEKSLKYYKIIERKELKEEEHRIALKKYEQLEVELKRLNRLINSLEVAEITKDIKKQQVIIEECITKIKKVSMDQDEINKELNNVGYTINKFYKEEVAALETTITELKTVVGNDKNIVQEKKRTLELISKEDKQISDKLATIKATISLNERSINEIANELELGNILLISDPKYIGEEIEKNNSLISNLVTDNKDLNKESENEKTEISKLSEDNKAIENEKNKNIKALANLENELGQYDKELKKINDKLSIYNIKRFDVENKDKVLEILDDKINFFGVNVDVSKLEINKKEEQKKRLSIGGINISSSFKKYLEDNQIEFMLGIDYIKETIPTEQMRKELISKNPLLPFAFVITEKNLLQIDDSVTELIVDEPIFVAIKEHIHDADMNPVSKFVKMDKTYGVYSLYNNDLVIKKDIAAEKKKLENEISVLNQNIKDWGKQNSDLNLIRDLIYNFSYAENYRMDIENKIRKEKEEIEQKIKQIKQNNDKKEEKEEKIRNIFEKVKENEKNINLIERKIVNLNKIINFLENNKENEKEEEKFLQKQRTNGKITNELRGIIEEKEKVIERNHEILNEKQVSLGSFNTILQEFVGFDEGTMQEGLIEVLKSRYYTLKSKSDISELDALKNKKGTAEKELEELIISKSRKTDYDEVAANRELKDKTNKEKDTINELKVIENGKITLLVNNIFTLENKAEELKNSIAPYEIVAKDSIKGNLEEEKVFVIDYISEITNDLSNVTNEIMNCEKIVDFIDNSKIVEKLYNEINKKFIEEYIVKKEEVFKKFNSIYIDSTNIMKDKEEVIKTDIGELFIFEGKDNLVDTSLMNLKVQIKEKINPAILNEIVFNILRTCDMYLEKIEVDLNVIEKEEHCLIEEYVDLANTFTQEILNFDKNSVIKLDGKRRKMMEIHNVRETEKSKYVLTTYLKDQLDKIITNLELDSKLMSKMIKTDLSMFELLNQYCELGNVVVKFLKVEENLAKSESREWEKVKSDNSGGERFLSYFVIFATVINYTRGNTLSKEQTSMTLIMDNPFAAISSEHLLKPVFDYAAKSNIQLICLSDHTKTDIVDRFDIIYRLMVRDLSSSKKEFLSKELLKQNQDMETFEVGTYQYEEQISF